MKIKKKIYYKNFIQNNFSYNNNSKFIKKYDTIIKKIAVNLDTNEDTFHSLSKNFKYNFNFEDLKKFKSFDEVVIIGMGGSILGAEAIYYFLKKKIKKNFIFLNNIDEEKIKKIKKKKNFKKMLFIIISKSGNTIETISNTLHMKIIKRNAKNIILISEKKNNYLYQISKKFRLFYIEHRNYIGGRYSVLSEVGMVPAYLMGVNINKFRRNLLSNFSINKNKFLQESSIKLANLLKRKKIRSLILFNYSPELNKFLYWVQQLIAESLGKNGKGFLPLISKAPKDHHSLLQLYLDGPKDKLFYIFSLEKSDNLKVNTNTFNSNLNFLNNKSLPQIKKAQQKAFVKVLRKKKIPFREFKICDLSEETLGELFSYFMIETAVLGKLVKLNPFDQPAVEQVKNETKKILI